MVAWWLDNWFNVPLVNGVVVESKFDTISNSLCQRR